MCVSRDVWCQTVSNQASKTSSAPAGGVQQGGGASGEGYGVGFFGLFKATSAAPGQGGPSASAAPVAQTSSSSLSDGMSGNVIKLRHVPDKMRASDRPNATER